MITSKQGVFLMNKIVEELRKTGAFYVGIIDGKQSRVRPFSSVTEFEVGFNTSGIIRYFQKILLK